MISSRHRFHGHNSLKFVYKTGSINRGSMFGVKSVVNTKRKSYRVAVVVSKKISKSAVARNKIRRRLYDCVRSLGSEINQPYDIVINVFSDQVLQESYDGLRSQLEKQFRQSKII